MYSLTRLLLTFDFASVNSCRNTHRLSRQLQNTNQDDERESETYRVASGVSREASDG